MFDHTLITQYDAVSLERRALLELKIETLQDKVNFIFDIEKEISKQYKEVFKANISKDELNKEINILTAKAKFNIYTLFFNTLNNLTIYVHDIHELESIIKKSNSIRDIINNFIDYILKTVEN